MVQFLNYVTYNDRQEITENKLPVFIGYKDIQYFQHQDKDIDNIMDDDKLLEEVLIRALKKGHNKYHKKYEYSKDEISDIIDSCGFEFFQVLPKFFAPKKK